MDPNELVTVRAEIPAHVREKLRQYAGELGMSMQGLAGFVLETNLEGCVEAMRSMPKARRESIELVD